MCRAIVSMIAFVYDLIISNDIMKFKYDTIIFILMKYFIRSGLINRWNTIK